MTKISAYEGSKALTFSSLNEIHGFAKMVTKTDLAPKGYRGKPEDATIAIIYGMEIGLPPMASLQNISVVNGTPTIWGDAQLSLVQSSGKYEYHKTSYEGEFPNDNFKAKFETKRINSKEPVIKEFSIADAKKANLWGKAGTWTTHPKVMLSYKARAFALREAFADILKGIHSKEEMEGEEIINVTPTPSKTANLHNATFENGETLVKEEPTTEEGSVIENNNQNGGGDE
ncbi:MAG: recombinase RecT [Candidatus Lokiarchaeota archaeon]|nr:recombinase RecT [Candidatus Lokiarchaeota archaeon]